MNAREWLQATLQRFESPLIHVVGLRGGIEPALDAVPKTFLELGSCGGTRAPRHG